MAKKTNTNINGNEYYRLRRTVDGKVKNFYGTSKADAERQYKEYLLGLSETEHMRSTATIQERADEYIENVLRVSDKYAHGTKVRYESSYSRHVRHSAFAKKTASTIKAADVQTFYNKLDVSKQTLKSVHKFMSGFFKWMERNEYAPNVLTAVELPTKEDNKRHDGIIIWDDDEIDRILNAPREPKSRLRHDFLIKVLLYTGMRIGEALALKYSDIEDDIIHVRRQVYIGEIKPPKYNSKRDIPLHRELIASLKEHRKWHKKDMKENGYKTDYIFTTNKGTLYGVENVRRTLNRFYDKIGVPHKNIHTYRATFCTTLCRCDVPLEVASALMGHKSLEVTAAHYALIRSESKADAIDMLSYDF